MRADTERHLREDTGCATCAKNVLRLLAVAEDHARLVEQGCGTCEAHVRIEALIERSSLGDEEAKAVRAGVPDDVGRSIALAAKYLGRAKAAKAERLDFASRLGFGDGVTEPAATLAQMVDPIEQAFSEAREWHEGPRLCEPCGEWLATATCDHCHGSGCGPGTATGGYEECEWCAGVGKVHPGCVEGSYVDLAAEVATLRAKVAAVEALADEWDERLRPGMVGIAAAIRAALDTTATEEGA